jgi:hypothetical protein
MGAGNTGGGVEELDWIKFWIFCRRKNKKEKINESGLVEIIKRKQNPNNNIQNKKKENYCCQ